jgi:hypothetical protein
MTFTLASRRTEMEFTVETADKVTTYSGTEFVPNWCEAKVYGGQIASVSLSRLDENKWGIDDPAGPDGAELHADFGGGELDDDAIDALPKVAQEALAAIKWALR